METAEKHAAADSVVCHDEPCLEDRLDRERYVKALAQLALTCQTPMVFGLYGGWGVGKTSMMLQIRQQIKDDGTPTVWFDPWRHQFDEDPIVALLQTMVVDWGRRKAPASRRFDHGGSRSPVQSDQEGPRTELR